MITQMNSQEQGSKFQERLSLLNENISQEDVDQKLLRSLSPEWNTHAVVWRSKADLDIMSMNDLYNNLKVEEGPNYALMAFSSSIFDSEIVVNCKKDLGYENYNAVTPPYTGNFIPPTPDLSFTGLDKFVNKHVMENCKAMSSEEEPKIVRKYDDAPSIKERVSDDEKEDVSQPKIEKKTVRPIIVKIEFVKSKQQEKTARKTVKQVEQHRQNTHSLRGNQRNWNNMLSQKL
nr:ribonuclease H-like domain-containing protein [Tanacetum cinerariifolium]